VGKNVIPFETCSQGEFAPNRNPRPWFLPHTAGPPCGLCFSWPVSRSRAPPHLRHRAQFSTWKTGVRSAAVPRRTTPEDRSCDIAGLCFDFDLLDPRVRHGFVCPIIDLSPEVIGDYSTSCIDLLHSRRSAELFSDGIRSNAAKLLPPNLRGLTRGRNVVQHAKSIVAGSSKSSAPQFPSLGPSLPAAPRSQAFAISSRLKVYQNRGMMRTSGDVDGLENLSRRKLASSKCAQTSHGGGQILQHQSVPDLNLHTHSKFWLQDAADLNFAFFARCSAV
jgi:hypothetical protein